VEYSSPGIKIIILSIPTLSLYVSIHDPNYIVGPGPDTPVIIGGILEIIVALAVLFGLTGQHSPLAGLAALLVALFEFSLGI